MPTIDIIDTQVFTALRTFLLSLAPSGAEVIRGQDNLVSMPKGNFATMTSTQMVRLATNIPTYSPLTGTGQKTVETKFRYLIQTDFYGPNSQPWAVQAKSLFRDDYAIEMFPDNIVPLFSDDAIQIPLIDGEQQYEQRWKLQMSLEYQPIITMDQDFATSLVATIKEVDAYYPV